MVSVRHIVEDDIAGFHAALDAVARESGFLRSTQAPPLDAVGAFVRNNIERKNPQFVAVTEAGDVVGWCDIVRDDGRHERHGGELGMGIVEAWRGQGIGKRLLAETVAAADAENFLRIELSVHADNRHAIALYSGAGFIEEGRKRRARLRSSMAVDVILMARLRPDRYWP